ncbi:MAG: putative toxin-antitoxin system toxin component, PIN family [Elusimicrobiota bacterium]
MKNKIKAVLDTNVFISGVINRAGVPGEILKAVKLGKFRLLTSLPINAEILEVLNRPKIKSKYKVTQFIPDIAFILTEIAEIIFNLPDIKISTDPDDDIFIETAVGGNADFLVTGDIPGLLRIYEYHGIKIISPAEFLKIISKL